MDTAHDGRDGEGAPEQIGRALGWIASPIFAATSALRHARTFHPEGRVLRATIEPIARDAWGGAIASRVAGAALARLSAALWKHDVEHVDVLGIALRLRDTESLSVEPAPGDQDLLFATIRSPFTMLASPFFTDARDYLANKYWGVAPFAIEAAGRVKLRLVPETRSAGGGSRPERLARTVARGDAAFVLEARRTFRPPYEAIARVRLLEEVDVDQEALRFSPFRDGRGIVPRGLVHALRAGAYRASQAARPRHS